VALARAESGLAITIASDGTHHRSYPELAQRCSKRERANQLTTRRGENESARDTRTGSCLLQERQEPPRLIPMDSALRHERRTSVRKRSETMAHSLSMAGTQQGTK